jgi:hypothetical protein
VTVSPRKSTETQGIPLPVAAHRKPRPDLYTALLVLALLAVLIGILFLYLEMSVYEFNLKGGPMGMVNQFSVVCFQSFVVSSWFPVHPSTFPLPLIANP